MKSPRVKILRSVARFAPRWLRRKGRLVAKLLVPQGSRYPHVQDSSIVCKDSYQGFVTTRDYAVTPVSRKAKLKLEAIASLQDLVRGKTVLDIGCRFGLICFRSVEYGARAAVGIDTVEDRVSSIERCVRQLGMERIRFVCGDFMGYQDPEDVVFFLSVLHHVYDQVGSLDTIAKHLSDLTLDSLVIEWIELNDPSIQKFNYQNDPGYSFAEFEKSVRRYFHTFEFLHPGHHPKSRSLFVAGKSGRTSSMRAIENGSTRLLPS